MVSFSFLSFTAVLIHSEYIQKFLLVISLALLQMVYLCCCAPATNQMETVPTVPEKTSPSKRSLIGFRGFENGEWPGEWNQFGNPWNGPSQPSHNSWYVKQAIVYRKAFCRFNFTL